MAAVEDAVPCPRSPRCSRPLQRADAVDHTPLRYSRGRINRAGKALATADRDRSSPEFREDMRVLNNWRAAHGFPLSELHDRLRVLATGMVSDAVVSQRLKTTPSTLSKLRRFPRMQLARMQDLGGCRAAVHTIEQVRELRDAYLALDLGHKLIRNIDYIERPKPSGYRGVHLIYRYQSDDAFNGLVIEVQMRSRLQHAWATAVETAGAFLQNALKFSEGEQEWLRFFALASSALALKEGSPTVPDTPSTESTLHREVREYATRLNVVARMREYGQLIRNMSTFKRIGAYYFLLERRPAEGMTLIIPYERDELEEASADYLAFEEEGRDVVLVSTDSLEDVRRAYPNYWLDARLFLREMEGIL